ncbi:hypothetical protein SHKM778_39240 [Streptomyces sp. KM77-8]|uniref:DhaK domain-containing protein n=1 Tax=Streptomyces haneummycinicus TaxID=3074435 RepID=A0AAT9HJD1_9ACTN
MKMLINVPETVVADALRGMAAAHPELAVDVEHRVIVRKDAPVAGKVGLVSGGGRGTSRCTAVSWGRGCCRRPVPGGVHLPGARPDGAGGGGRGQRGRGAVHREELHR